MLVPVLYRILLHYSVLKVVVLHSSVLSVKIWSRSIRLRPVRGKGRSHLLFLNKSNIDLSFARRRTPGYKGVVMSRNLPPHPNLEHLRKQAKGLLHGLKQRNPASKLAEAQHALAREYGFASWLKLKIYVESLPRPTPVDSQPKVTNPFVGTWTANLSKSRRHPVNQFQSATLQVEVVGDTVTIMDIVVDASGREEHGKNTILVDGNEHASEERNGYVLLATWRGSHVLETVAKKDGQVAGWGRNEVSDDGKTLTISGDEQMIVLDRN